MEKRYDVYCIADTVFFDSPATAADKDLAFGVTDRPLPAGWTRSPQDDWLVCRPDGARRPGQGWKIHASARTDNAEKVLDAVWNYCLDRGIPFKFLKGRHVLQTRNMKYAPRAASGKLVTIYPQDEKELRETLEGLDREIGGEPGPYMDGTDVLQGSHDELLRRSALYRDLVGHWQEPPPSDPRDPGDPGDPGDPQETQSTPGESGPVRRPVRASPPRSRS